MGKIRNILTAIVLGSALALSTGCDDKPKESEYVTGTVLKESGTIKPKESEYVTGTVLRESGTIIDRQKVIERSEGALFGNDSVRFGDPTYAIQFKVEEFGKVYTFAIKESYQRKLVALNLAIEEGTRIRMSRQNFNYHLNGMVGQVMDYNLEVLAK